MYHDTASIHITIHLHKYLSIRFGGLGTPLTEAKEPDERHNRYLNKTSCLQGVFCIAVIERSRLCWWPFRLHILYGMYADSKRHTESGSGFAFEESFWFRREVEG